ncbi:uncharacterized protein LOC133192075 isoform X2 [Saccostrea echinata]|uniref:uncharacterized protein LOC133192075 isoform X2 n=1 Tax=Saccostrea echinata TaxID=191078 RepID=UPI002A7F4966|nr:uncharacterized protein LOC133192075 isoform X2 [Saccostrea echinata]
MMKNDSSASDFSHSSSQGSSDENEFPTSTSSWPISFIDKFGIRKVMKNPFEIVRTLWGLCILTDSEVFRIDEIVKVCNLQYIDCDSLEEIPYYDSTPYEEWVKEKFPQMSVKELKLFNEHCEEFGYFLFNTLQRIHQPKKRENQLPYEIQYQLLFEKFLKLFDFKVQSQPYLPTGRATIFGQEISSKADILCSKWNDPMKILSICEEIHSTVHFQEKSTEVKRKSPEEGADFSPVKKKLRSAASTLETVNEEASSSTGLVPGLSSDVYAQHVGELLAYFESSVSPNGLIGMVVQKTNKCSCYCIWWSQADLYAVNGCSEEGIFQRGTYYFVRCKAI